MTAREKGQAGVGGESSKGTAPKERWIETPRGYLFFLNALLVAPPVMVLVPLVLRWILRTAGLVTGPSVFLDPFPLIAQYVLPYLGWLLLLPMGLIIWNLRVETARRPRMALLLFLAVHGGFLTWTLWWWITGQPRVEGL